MKRIILAIVTLIFMFSLSACGRGENTVTPNTPTPTAGGQGDDVEGKVPSGADVIRQGVYYYELVELSGDLGEGVSPRDGAVLADELLTSTGFYSDNGGIPTGKCVYISLDELVPLESAMGRECYIYSIGLGTPEGGLMGDDYQVVYRISVDYSGKKTAAIYEDFSGGNSQGGQGDLFVSDPGVSGFTLVADFSNGAESNIKTKKIPLPPQNEMPSSKALVAFYLADELSEWTGLDFKLNHVRIEGDSANVDWSAYSTLISGLGSGAQKDEFHFYDAVSLNWFMMDSLAKTFKRNLDVTTIYYNSEGKKITFTNPEDMASQGLPGLPIDQPYEGSTFFVTHANNQ